MVKQTQYPSWLNNQLIAKVRSRYEPLYNRKLTSTEIIEIANNLVNIIEITLNIKIEGLSRAKTLDNKLG